MKRNWTTAFHAFAIILLSIAPCATAQPRKPLTAAQKKAVLNDVRQPHWSTKAPETFVADMETSKGKVAIEFTRSWSPNGVDRFYNLIRAGYYDDTRFYRVVPNFVAQFGIAADPDYANYWGRQLIKPDPVK